VGFFALLDESQGAGCGFGLAAAFFFFFSVIVLMYGKKKERGGQGFISSETMQKPHGRDKIQYL
jgi:hypothetical protein